MQWQSHYGVGRVLEKRDGDVDPYQLPNVLDEFGATAVFSPAESLTHGACVVEETPGSVKAWSSVETPTAAMSRTVGGETPVTD